jgi:hypothetical protein
MKVTKANGNISVVECFVTVTPKSLKMAEGMILSIKKQ